MVVVIALSTIYDAAVRGSTSAYEALGAGCNSRPANDRFRG